MSRIATPATISDAPSASQPVLEEVKKSIGSVPNLFRIVSNSPAALEGYLGLNNALGKGSLDAATRERIALAIGQINHCDYCLAAHTYIGQNVAKLNGVEIIANRRGGSTDAKANVAVRFAADIVRNRGDVSDQDIAAVRAAGYSDAEIVEIIAHTALNTLTNYLNKVLQTDVDFPAAKDIDAAVS